jgi:hypothetical protein
MNFSSQVVVESGKIPFAGLSPCDGDVEIDRVIAEDIDIPRYPEQSLKDIIELLPHAERRRVEIDNSFVAGNGIVDTDSVQSTVEETESMGADMKEFPSGSRESVYDVGRKEPTQRAHDVAAIVDPRREALAALGQPVDYHWQIGGGDYAIVNPTDWYYKAHQTLEKHGERRPIGWVEFDDYGGAVDLYVLLPSQRFMPLSVDDEDREPVYLGFHSGYRFDGSRSLDYELFGYDLEQGVGYWGLGQRKSQPHRGNVMSYAGDWWESGYEDIQEATSIDGGLLSAINDASDLKLDFGEDGAWSPAEFVEHVGLPTTYAEEIADRALQMAGDPDLVSIWNFYININAVIDSVYSGENKSRNSMTFQGYTRTARKLLQNPKQEINRARRSYAEGTEGESVPDSQRTLGESVDDIASVVQDESELSDVERMTVTKEVQKRLGESNP